MNPLCDVRVSARLANSAGPPEYPATTMCPVLLPHEGSLCFLSETPSIELMSVRSSEAVAVLSPRRSSPPVAMSSRTEGPNVDTQLDVSLLHSSWTAYELPPRV